MVGAAVASVSDAVPVSVVLSASAPGVPAASSPVPDAAFASFSVPGAAFVSVPVPDVPVASSPISDAPVVSVPVPDASVVFVPVPDVSVVFSPVPGITVVSVSGIVSGVLITSAPFSCVVCALTSVAGLALTDEFSVSVKAEPSPAAFSAYKEIVFVTTITTNMKIAMNCKTDFLFRLPIFFMEYPLSLDYTFPLFASNIVIMSDNIIVLFKNRIFKSKAYDRFNNFQQQFLVQFSGHSVFSGY
jgi:hypothetical protein